MSALTGTPARLDEAGRRRGSGARSRRRRRREGPERVGHGADVEHLEAGRGQRDPVGDGLLGGAAAPPAYIELTVTLTTPLPIGSIEVEGAVGEAPGGHLRWSTWVGHLTQASRKYVVVFGDVEAGLFAAPLGL